MAKKSAPKEKNQGGARTAFPDEQVADFKAKFLELIPQGKTLRQILAEPGMCSMTYLFRELLPNDEDFSKQYALAFELRNEYWAEELAEIADDGSNDWMDVSTLLADTGSSIVAAPLPSFGDGNIPKLG
jgi:hypothetical protein